MEYHRARGHTLGKLPTNWKDLANFIAGKRSRFRLGHVKKSKLYQSLLITRSYGRQYRNMMGMEIAAITKSNSNGINDNQCGCQACITGCMEYANYT